MSSTSRSYGDPATRQRLLDATRALVEAQGAAVRLGDVAKAAGVSRQALYLHFGDRTSLMLALVDHVDETSGLQELFEPILTAPTGAEALRAMLRLHAAYSSRIDAIARVLEAAADTDPALAAAWRDRMTRRHRSHRDIVQRLADEGALAPGWTVDTAADVFFAVTMPGPWRELTRQLGWSEEDYVEHMTRLLATLIG